MTTMSSSPTQVSVEQQKPDSLKQEFPGKSATKRLVIIQTAFLKLINNIFTLLLEIFFLYTAGHISEADAAYVDINGFEKRMSNALYGIPSSRGDDNVNTPLPINVSLSKPLLCNQSPPDVNNYHQTIIQNVQSGVIESSSEQCATVNQGEKPAIIEIMKNGCHVRISL